MPRFHLADSDLGNSGTNTTFNAFTDTKMGTLYHSTARLESFLLKLRTLELDLDGMRSIRTLGSRGKVDIDKQSNISLKIRRMDFGGREGVELGLGCRACTGGARGNYRCQDCFIEIFCTTLPGTYTPSAQHLVLAILFPSRLTPPAASDPPYIPLTVAFPARLRRSTGIYVAYRPSRRSRDISYPFSQGRKCPIYDDCGVQGLREMTSAGFAQAVILMPKHLPNKDGGWGVMGCALEAMHRNDWKPGNLRPLVRIQDEDERARWRRGCTRTRKQKQKEVTREVLSVEKEHKKE
ncbi:uncharacterized protein EV420DRAFT_1697454 [Desarmillaria tabescens]|uniref:Uncharacterized protein n=1 Tax=Armillaria tabescens TaxID=1929756 RepID=A0AA39K3V5_ARMTA|nr:uncharacterized protein EV420DRAFT_1697454 [Desarmillaria tabescens]KAK0452876.1 hypothetical protein EV420DRAFT_1697454 [Desarmillaria tabescens]